MLFPKNIALRNNLLVPYHVPLKFGLSAKRMTLPEPIFDTIIDAAPGMNSFLFNLEIYPSI